MNHKRCCCNCSNQVELRKHPCNKDFGKGSIMDVCGYVCLGLENTIGIYFDNKHGECEMFNPKKINDNHELV